MRKIREVLRLKWSLKLSDQQIAESCRLSVSTVWEYVRRAREADLSWPLPEALSDAELEQKLFAGNPARHQERPEPDWSYIYTESKKKGVTLLLLWREYIQEYPLGHGYVNFTILFRRWKKEHGGSEVSLRQEYKAGEKLFVDYAGMTIAITDPSNGEIRAADIFVATLGLSNYSYAEASWSQGLEDWLASHRRALEFFGGVPEIIVPDNLKSGVRQACYFEPDINRSYLEFAEHYGVAIIPTRVRKPKDKAKVEKGVQTVEQAILAVLRQRLFFSLAEANEAIWSLLVVLNNKAFQKLAGTRKSCFEALDKPALRPLPKTPYELASWKKATVHPDYHVEVDKHFYSVPYRYAREKVELRLTQNSIEIFCQGQRIASHQRLPQLARYQGRHSTLAEHMPSQHQYRSEWHPERFISWAKSIGEHTAQVIDAILNSRQHPEQSFRSCFGVLRLAKSYGHERLEAACKRACFFKAYRFKSIEAILKNKLEQEPLPSEQTQMEQTQQAKQHQNVRGAAYYSKN